MGAVITIAVPALGRPHRAAPLVENIRRCATVETEILYVVTPGDTGQATAARAAGADRVIETPWIGGRGDYARKINLALASTDAPWLFTGADDLEFTRGWDDRALTAARHGAGWVGTDDRCNPRTRGGRKHSTHSLVARRYADEHGTLDERGLVYDEGYWHNFVDDEGVGTARHRGQYASSRAVVRHFHPMRRSAPDDETYALGRLHFREDATRYRERRERWGGGRSWKGTR